MSVVAPRPRRRVFWPRRRLLVVLAAAALVVAVVALLGVRGYLVRQYEARLREVVAQTDELDPRWRWDDVLADRREVPDDQNSALRVLAAAERMPGFGVPPAGVWPPRRPPALRVIVDRPEPEQQAVATLAGTAALAALAHVHSAPRPDWWSELSGLAPDVPLPGDLLAELRADLAQRQEALALVRQVAGLPKGRYPIQWDPNPFRTPLPHADALRSLGVVLRFDLSVAVEEGDRPRAVLDCRALLGAAHSLGDEPLLVVQLLRWGLSETAVSGLERTLAATELFDADLEAVGAVLWLEEDQFVLERTWRGERARIFEMHQKVAEDGLTLEELGGSARADDLVSRLYRWAWVRPSVRRVQSVVLEQMTVALAHARQRGPARLRGLEELWAGVRKLRDSSPQTGALFEELRFLTRVVVSVHLFEARVRSAVVALALEKYRQRHGRWPEALPQLVPAFLPRVPDDPFADAPLRYARTETGVVVYSVGKNATDDGGVLVEDLGKSPDVGFRLWDLGQRRLKQGGD